MTLTILEDSSPGTPAIAPDFVSVADLGNKLGQNLSADPNALAAVAAACDICRTIAEQTFTAVVGDTITLDGTGSDALLLPEGPVTAVTAVSVDGEASTDWMLTNAGVLVLPKHHRWTAGRQNVVITYDHGYPPENFPQDVKRVALAIALRLYGQDDVRQESIGSYSVTYAVAATDLTAGEKAILRKHRRT